MIKLITKIIFHACKNPNESIGFSICTAYLFRIDNLNDPNTLDIRMTFILRPKRGDTSHPKIILLDDFLISFVYLKLTPFYHR